jgi:three-Cys-motif partner protein
MAYNSCMTSSGSPDRIADVKRELLVRHLEAWTPAALHRARRATYAHGYADADGGKAAEAALRVFAEQPDLVRGRELSMVAIAEDVTGPQQALAAVQEAAGAAAGLVVHTVPGATDERLGVALKAIGATRVPLLGFLDASTAAAPPARATVAALGIGKPAEVLLVLAPDALARLAAPDADLAAGDRFFGGQRWRTVLQMAGEPEARRRAFLVEEYRTVLREAGFPLVAAVELVADPEADGELLIYATTSGKSLEGFKEALWAADEYAGVRYRDPGDPERHLIDISLTPHPGPLRRELLAHLATVGECTVTDLRTYALTETVYRSADATRVLGTLLTAGAVNREPEHGRLGGDVVIAPAGPAVSEDDQAG